MPIAPPVAPVAPTLGVSGVATGALLTHQGQLHFAACGDSGVGSPIADRADGEATMLLAEFVPDGGRISAVVRITSDSLREIRYAGLEGPTCDELLSAGVLEARGQEPFWHLVVLGDSATRRTPEQPEGMTWVEGVWDELGGGAWRFRAVRPPVDSLVLEVHPARCADGMSGARYPYRVELVAEDRRLSGCALEGRSAPAP